MSRKKRWGRRFRLPIPKDAELSEELSFHLESQIQAAIQSGLDPAQARRLVLRDFGGVEQIKEECRDVHRIHLIENFLQDARYALRTMRRTPGFTAVAMVSLALGIGANTAIFSLIDAVLLKPLPVQNPQQLVQITATGAPERVEDFNYGTFDKIRERNQVFSGMFAVPEAHYNMRLIAGSDQQPDAVLGEFVSGSQYSTLGLPAAAGRMLTPDDDRPGAPAVVVISHGFWKRRFALDPAVVGQSVRLNTGLVTIVGVTPPDYFGIELGGSADIWVPFAAETVVMGEAFMRQPPGIPVRIMARLKTGVTLPHATAALDALYHQIQDEASLPAQRIELMPGSQGLAGLRTQFSLALRILMVVVGLVLLIACANVANLLLARAAARQREIAVRIAIGAGRGRLVRQLLTESLMLALAGGALGLIVGMWGQRMLVGFMSQTQFTQIGLNPSVLTFTAAVAVLTGLLFGLAPALRASRMDLTPAMKQRSSAGTLPLGKALVVVQVALSLLLLISAGLFVRSLENLKNLDAGFHADRVVLVRVGNAGMNYKTAQTSGLHRQVLERMEALPGVQSASLSNFSLLAGDSMGGRISVPGYSPALDENTETMLLQVAPRFFETMGMRMLRGRPIDWHDGETSSKVAVINETMARYFFRNQSPIGRHFSFAGRSNSDFEIVGVVADSKYENLREKTQRTAYTSYFQGPLSASATYAVHTAGDPLAMAPALRQAVMSVDKGFTVRFIRTFTDQVDHSLSRERLVAALSSFFGGLALLLACIGLYGIMSYTVARRITEIGIRMALGARRGTVIWNVLRETLTMTMLGVVIGIPIALAAARLVSSQLFGLNSSDPLTIALATLLLILIAAIAGYLPARRASRVDPLVALRYE